MEADNQAGAVLYELYPEDIIVMIDSIETSISDRRAGKAVKTPFAKIMPEGEEAEMYIDVSYHC
jgi:hypothetical protein